MSFRELRDDPSAIPYMSNRTIVRRSGHSVVFPSDCDLVEVFCPVCTFIVRSRDDEHAMRTLGCCEPCARRWAYPNLERWKDGWRPSDEESASVERRTMAAPKLDVG